MNAFGVSVGGARDVAAQKRCRRRRVWHGVVFATAVGTLSLEATEVEVAGCAPPLAISYVAPVYELAPGEPVPGPHAVLMNVDANGVVVFAAVSGLTDDLDHSAAEAASTTRFKPGAFFDEPTRGTCQLVFPMFYVSEIDRIKVESPARPLGPDDALARAALGWRRSSMSRAETAGILGAKVEVSIDAKGRVRSVKSIGGENDEMSKTLVEHLRSKVSKEPAFSPALRKGRPVASRLPLYVDLGSRTGFEFDDEDIAILDEVPSVAIPVGAEIPVSGT
jgi:hypothetical protein